MSSNNVGLVREVIIDLESNNISVLLGGGWAEEILKIQAPRAHKDIDLYLISSTFDALDEYLSHNNLAIFKHMPHKRAYFYKDVPVEVILIQKDSSGYFSDYREHSDVIDSVIIRWPNSIETKKDTLGLLSPEALQFKRDMHSTLFPQPENSKD